MPERETQEAYHRSSTCDLFIVVGSSLVVQPAASMPLVAKRNGARLAIINRDPTPYDGIADVVVLWSGRFHYGQYFGVCQKGAGGWVTRRTVPSSFSSAPHSSGFRLPARSRFGEGRGALYLGFFEQPRLNPLPASY